MIERVNNIFVNIVTYPDVTTTCYDCGKSNVTDLEPFYRISEDYIYDCKDCYRVKLNSVASLELSINNLDPSDVNYKFADYLTYVLIYGHKFEKLL